MKYPVLFFILLTSFISYSQNSLKGRIDSVNNLSNKWELVKTTVNGEDQDQPDGKSFFIINKNGNYQLTTNSKKLIAGKWKLDTKKTFSQMMMRMELEIGRS
jgi:hypothetical protein